MKQRIGVVGLFGIIGALASIAVVPEVRQGLTGIIAMITQRGFEGSGHEDVSGDEAKASIPKNKDLDSLTPLDSRWIKVGIPTFILHNQVLITASNDHPNYRLADIRVTLPDQKLYLGTLAAGERREFTC